VIAGLATLTYAIIEGRTAGWLSPWILALFAVALGSFAGLIRYERHHEEPLIDARFFRSAPFSGASAIAVLAFAGLGSFLFLNTLYLQDVRGLSPLEAGLLMLPMAGMTLVFGPLSGRLVGRVGARPSLTVAGGAMMAASLLLTQLRVHSSEAFLIATYVVFGLGFGLVNPPITNTAVSGMPAAQAGVAAGIASTSRQVGMTLGVAVAGAIAGSGITRGIGPGFAAATHPAWWLVAGLSGTMLALGFLTTGGWAHDTARRAAALLEPERPRDAHSRNGRAAPAPARIS
jgi:predicted MFS family arabinose efflux permease